MTKPNPSPRPTQPDDALRRLVFARASAINGKLLARLSTVSDDLDAGDHLAALGALDGLEHDIVCIRSFLLLLS
jgi:hypothetical protein